jgi:hypothetical protein
MKRRAKSPFFPWRSRKPQPIGIKHKIRGFGKFYDAMTDGSVRNPDHERHERRVLGLSARQHRNMKKQLRRGEG